MLLLVAIAVGVGLGGLALFVQLGPVDSLATAAALGALLYLAGGAAVGALFPTGRGSALAALNAWSAVLLGSVGLGVSITAPQPGDLPTALGLLVVPLALSLLGGRIGARARRSRRETVPD